MSERPQKPVPQEPEADNPSSTIFSKHKSADDLRKEQKEEKQKERRQFMRELTESTSSPETRAVTRVMIILLAVIVVGCAVVVFFQIRPKDTDMAADSPHFEDVGALPELSQEGIKAIVTEAYYTIDGSLALRLQMSNGLPTPQAVESISIVIYNDQDKEIASGHQSSDWDASFTVPANSYAELLVYIPKEDVKIPDDTLETLTTEIDVTGIPEDASVLKTTTAPTTSTIA